MTVRPAQETDFARVTELLEALGRAKVRHDEYAAARDVYVSQLRDRDAAHLVAVVGGAVVGFCSLHFRMRLNHTTPQAWIPDLFVDPAARGGGVAK
ncbi:MAG TPA: GNAT family N-acetyltransferase, partial [Vicinamibacteria bacterium]|nr:GNAT family N-acetyltransferase [Vicinamibacteria bacterium]